MKDKISRIIIAGTGSGCGKTTITCALIRALADRGLDVGTFKCGPDYIDPMFHREITGRKSSNLDSFFFDDATLKYLLAKNGRRHEINIIEGVMGFYDGILEKGLSLRGSTYDISRITKTPVILTVNARGAAASVLAVIHGFLTYIPDNHICGVIFNQCTSSTYQLLETEIRTRFKGCVQPLGYFPVMKDCSLESRHLGLVTAAEVGDLQEKLEKLGTEAAECLKLDEIADLAGRAPEISSGNIMKEWQEKTAFDKDEKVRIAVARDRAFCFYYDDSLSLLEELGAELVPFSPLSDPCLPDDIHGLYLGGGYPELYARELSENRSMLRSVNSAMKGHLPCIAECGGFMYLTRRIGTYSMAGFIDTESFDTGKLSRFGYISLKAGHDNMLCRKGEGIAAHEFHYWDAGSPGKDFAAVKPSGRRWECGYAGDHLYAGFAHFHFCSNPGFAVNFLNACSRYKEKIQKDSL